MSAMTHATDSMDGPDDPVSRSMLEGFAKVVALDGNLAWLEPEKMSACGSCQSATACGAKNEFGRSKDSQRFSLANTADLKVGDRVVVGTFEDSLVRASLAAYVVPIVTMLIAAMLGQAMIGSDAAAAGGAVIGLVIGLFLARWRAGRMHRRGDLTPRFLRRAFNEGLGDDCSLG